MFPYKDPAATDLLATAIGLALAATFLTAGDMNLYTAALGAAACAASRVNRQDHRTAR